MKVAVLGLWHLGTVTAACLASAGHDVVGIDTDANIVAALREGRPPVFEPGLEELVKDGLRSTKLSFSSDMPALREAELVWVTFDTPVDEDDRADIRGVVEAVKKSFSDLAPSAVVVISSQLPVGTTAKLENACATAFKDKQVVFANSPENLRLGRAIAAFMRPDRVVVGVAAAAARERIEQCLRPITNRIEWMSVESAEMTKHALNAFLAMSVAYANEVASICETVGADAAEVERGLKSESRIGPSAYLSPGSAVSGGTLLRDVGYLVELGGANAVPVHLLTAVRASNDAHKTWTRRRLADALGTIRGRRISVWGLTYKPGTSTLRRSGAIELCDWLSAEGATVSAHDPVVRMLPAGAGHGVIVHDDPLAAAAGADALVLATPWPEYRAVSADAIVGVLAQPLVLDAGRFLAETIGADPRVTYLTVGKRWAR
jgi:UDPglucose 6-dehydrogenase